MNRKRATFRHCFLAFGLVFGLVTMAAALGDPHSAFAQTPPPEGNAAAPLPPPPPAPSPYAVQPTPPPYAVPINDPEYNRMYPKQRPYDDGPVPPGYHIAERRSIPLIVAGSSIFGGFYFFAVTGTLISGKPQYAIPIAGPLLGIETRSNDSLDALGNTVANFFLVFDAIGQAVGAGLLIAGIPPRTYLLRNDLAFKPQFSIGPGSVQMQMKF